MSANHSEVLEQTIDTLDQRIADQAATIAALQAELTQARKDLKNARYGFDGTEYWRKEYLYAKQQLNTMWGMAARSGKTYWKIRKFVTDEQMKELDAQEKQTEQFVTNLLRQSEARRDAAESALTDARAIIANLREVERKAIEQSEYIQQNGLTKFEMDGLRAQLDAKQEVLDRIHYGRENWRRGFMLKQNELVTCIESRRRVVWLVREYRKMAENALGVINDQNMVLRLAGVTINELKAIE